MLLHGDELGRTQQGNNNVYAQDNELAWVDWNRAREFEVLTDFVGRISTLRKEHPVFRRRRFFKGHPVKGTPLEDIGWFKPDGEQMSDEDWESSYARSVAVFLNGEGIREPDARGERMTDRSFFLLFNAHDEAIEFCIPELGAVERWHVVIDTHAPMLDDVDARAVKSREPLLVEARSVVVLQQVF
jgi:isoamylase